MEFTEVPTEEAIPEGIDPPPLERQHYYKLLFSLMMKVLFNQMKLKSLLWGFKGTEMMKSKNKCGGIMVSNFIHVDEHWVSCFN